MVECHGSSHNNSVCEGDGDDDDGDDDYDYIDDETLICLESCVGPCGYNDDYDYVNVDDDIIFCYYLCAENVCGITF